MTATTTPSGPPQFALQDPDGYLLRLTQNIGTRPRRQ